MATFGKMTREELVEYTHNHCPEWKDPVEEFCETTERYCVKDLPLWELASVLNKEQDYEDLLEKQLGSVLYDVVFA